MIDLFLAFIIGVIVGVVSLTLDLLLRAKRDNLQKKEPKFLFTSELHNADNPDPNDPLFRYEWETETEFIDRVSNKLNEGKLTINAARKTFGLSPIDK